MTNQSGRLAYRTRLFFTRDNFDTLTDENLCKIDAQWDQHPWSEINLGFSKYIDKIYMSTFQMHFETQQDNPTLQGVKKRMDPLGIFACFITVSFQFLEIYSYEQVKPNKTKLFVIS